MRLYESFPERITVDGVTYRLSLSFDRVLRYFELFDNSELTASDIDDIGFEWLVVKPRNASAVQKNKVLAKIRTEIICPPQRSLCTQKKQPRAVDFSYDADEIYSSFMQAYGIDLVKQRGKMHWCAFIALFRGLPEDTPIKQIMSIRTREMPAPTKNNAGYIQNLTNLKTLYALPSDKTESSSETLNRLFDFLLTKAGE